MLRQCPFVSLLVSSQEYEALDWFCVTLQKVKEEVLGFSVKVASDFVDEFKISLITSWWLPSIGLGFLTSLSCIWISVHERFQPHVFGQFFFVDEFVWNVKLHSKFIRNGSEEFYLKRISPSPVLWCDVLNYIPFRFHSKHGWNRNEYNICNAS